MLLSRVAEAVYWTGRYLERAEATARILRVHTEMYLDLPRSAGLSWEPLLAITGSREEFDAHQPRPTEEAVTSFLAFDTHNQGSVVASLAAARENMRTARAVFPVEAWEVLNDMYLRAVESCEDVVRRRERLRWTRDLVSESQQLAGLVNGTMSQDEAYRFFCVGVHVERADMTTRVVDVRGEYLTSIGDRADPYTEVTLMGVLRSLSADQMYRRAAQSRLQGSEALRFLLADAHFPRSIEHCLVEISRSLLELCNHEAPMARCALAQQALDRQTIATIHWRDLRTYIEDLQERIAEVHDEIDATYFRRIEHVAQRLADHQVLATA